jgi:hypothetical protein
MARKPFFAGMFPDVKGLTEKFDAKFEELRQILVEIRDVLVQIRDKGAA